MAKCSDLGAEYWFMYAFSVAYRHWRICITSLYRQRHTLSLIISFSFSRSYKGFYFEVELDFMTPPQKACRKNIDADCESAP